MGAECARRGPCPWPASLTVRLLQDTLTSGAGEPSPAGTVEHVGVRKVPTGAAVVAGVGCAQLRRRRGLVLRRTWSVASFSLSFSNALPIMPVSSPEGVCPTEKSNIPAI